MNSGFGMALKALGFTRQVREDGRGAITGVENVSGPP